MLKGHNAAISEILVDNEGGYIISLSDDKVLKIWNSRSMSCLQTLQDPLIHRPEDCISYIHLDVTNGQLLLGSDVIMLLPVNHFT